MEGVYLSNNTHNWSPSRRNRGNSKVGYTELQKNSKLHRTTKYGKLNTFPCNYPKRKYTKQKKHKTTKCGKLNTFSCN